MKQTDTINDLVHRDQCLIDARVLRIISDVAVIPSCPMDVFVSHAAPVLYFLPDEREAVQKKTFTKWVNSILSRVGCRISDLYLDLRDGRMLIKLLEVLSGERLVSFLTRLDFTY